MDHEIFSEKFYWLKYLGLWSPGLRIFFEKLVKHSCPPPTYLMYAPLITAVNKMFWMSD